MGKELLKAIKDAYNREQTKTKIKEKFSDDVEELCFKYGNKYDFLNCYYYQFLNQFDNTILRTCELANKATMNHGDPAIWFNVLMGLGEFSDKVLKTIEEHKTSKDKEKSEKYKLISSFFIRYNLDVNDIEKLINDFILKRKSYIIITYSTFNISAQDSVDKLGLDLRSIQYIFDFKLKDNKLEKRLLELSNILFKKEIMIAG